MNLTAIVLAAGQGTRMKSDLPKVLHQISGKSLLAHVLDNISAAEIEEKIVVLGHKGEEVAKTLPENVRIAYQYEQKGTGHAVMQAAELLPKADGTVLIICGDTPLISAQTIKAMYALHQEKHAAVTVLSAIAPNPFGYGRIKRENGQVAAIVEQKDATAEEAAILEINAGTYFFDQKFLLENLPKLSTDNAQGEYYLTDLIKLACTQNLPCAGFITDFAEIMGVNNRLQLAQAQKYLLRRKAEQLMLAGVTIIDPEQTYIEENVTIGADTVIWPGCLLKGAVTIGSSCEIGPHVELKDTVIADATDIKYTVTNEVKIGSNCHIGPFAYLRPGTVLADNVKIGDFVEVKKSTVGEGSKLPHLSYIGDATVGEGVNIGCGTITCNYDGKNKYPTTIGDHAFIGSNSNLVAPVTVSEGAFIAAGATITENIPPYSLAINRPPLTVKEGWVLKKQQKEQDKQ